MMKKNKKTKYLLYVVVATVIIFVTASYGKVEFLTFQYGDEFSKEYNQIGMFDEIEYFKVMEYTDGVAQVYYVIKDRSAGVLVNYLKIEKTWSLDTWKTVWSSSGSANGLIWPYYR